MRPGKGAERLPTTEPPQAARPSRLTAAYLQCGGSSREPLGAEARTGAASPALSSKYAPPVPVHLSAASRRLVRGRRSRGNSAGFCSGLAALAAAPLLGLLVAASRDAKIERLRAMYKTGQITYMQLYALFLSGKITAEELNRILKP